MSAAGRAGHGLDVADVPAKRVVVVDGSNLATEGRTTPSLRQLDEAVRAYSEEDPEAEIVVVVDASFEHRIDPSEREQLVDAELHGEVVSPPAGAIGRGDAFVLRIAERTGARVLSNDSFQEFHGEHPWLFDEDRLIGGKPVPGVGWIFTPRIPVRGPKSRQATSKGKRSAAEGLSAPVKAAELAKAAKKLAARSLPVMPDGSLPKVGDVWPPVAAVPAAAPSRAKAVAKAAKSRSATEAAKPEAAKPEAAKSKAAKAKAAKPEVAKPAAKAAKAGVAAKAAKSKPAAKAAAKAAKPKAPKSRPATEAGETEAAEPATGVLDGSIRPVEEAPAPGGTAGGGSAGKRPAKRVAGARPAKASKVEKVAQVMAAVEEGAEKAPPRAAPARARAKKAQVVAAAKAPGIEKIGMDAVAPGTAAGSGVRAREQPPVAGRPRGLEDPVVVHAIDDAMAEALAPPDESDGGRGRRDVREDERRPAKGARRRRRRATAPPPAVNEPLAFIAFVATYPLQSELEGEVVSFTSHGAMVDVALPGGGNLHCYIPLGSLGDPPPTKARQVLARGERRRFVLVGLDPPRRVAELALPEVAAVGATAG